MWWSLFPSYNLCFFWTNSVLCLCSFCSGTWVQMRQAPLSFVVVQTSKYFIKKKRLHFKPPIFSNFTLCDCNSSKTPQFCLSMWVRKRDEDENHTVVMSKLKFKPCPIANFLLHFSPSFAISFFSAVFYSMCLSAQFLQLTNSTVHILFEIVGIRSGYNAAQYQMEKGRRIKETRHWYELDGKMCSFIVCTSPHKFAKL